MTRCSLEEFFRRLGRTCSRFYQTTRCHFT